MKKFNIQEGLDAINRIKLLMEYSLDKTLTENQEVIFEQNNPQTPTQYTWASPNLATSSSPQFAKTVKSNYSFAEFMEDYRESLFSIKGITIQAFLEGFEITAPAVIAAWGALVGWDVYEMFTNYSNFSWGSFILDLIGFFTAGVAAARLSSELNAAKNIKTEDDVVNFIKAKGWKKYLIEIGNGIQNILSSISKGINWLVKKFNATKLGGMVNKILDWIKSTVERIVSKLTTPEVGKAAGKAAKVGSEQGLILNTGILTVKGIKAVGTALYKFLNSSSNNTQFKSYSDDVKLKKIKEYIMVDYPDLNGKITSIEIIEKDKKGNITKLKINNAKYSYHQDENYRYIVTEIK